MKKLCVVDIETDSFNVDDAKVKFVGILDLQTNEYKIIQYEEPDEIQTILTSYDFVITFNGEQYDLPILRRHEIIVPMYKHIDLYKIYKKRAPLLRSGGFKSYSLNNIAKTIGLEEEKGKIDYSIFKKNKWTEEELEEISRYLKQDLNITKKLWLFLIKKFDSLKEFISEKDVNEFKHITSSSGAYGYKVICNLLGIREEYEDIPNPPKYKGGYVMPPKKETIKGNILCFDFASLYPMMFIHSNLFSSKCECCLKEDKWHGNDDFRIDGYYCSKHQGRIEELIKEFYVNRKLYKLQKDSRQFALKIILNTIYGISAKPSFKNIYNETTASDCTALARQCIDFAIKRFEENMYNVVYTDTDSCFIELKPYQKRELCMRLAEEISIKISRQFPFPFDEFNLKLDEGIKYLQFFIGRNGELNKKHYLYVNDDDKLTIKGLDIIQKNCSELSLKIFENVLKSDIIKNLDCKFDKEFIDNLINKTIKNDKTIIAKRFNIKPLKYYKSKTSIYYLIGEKYGDGEIFLIKNYRLGAGKGIKYCSVNEAKELEVEDLNLEDVYRELSPFIKDYVKEKEKEKKVGFEDISMQMELW